jgi:ABC-type bacteriocin/lantibiotic exporter with double-glycine peptidase domain
VLDKPLSQADLSRLGDDLRQTGGLYGFVLRISLYHQIGLALITVLLFLVSAVPLELQRRIIDDALQRGNLRSILLLAFAYVGVAILQGGIKLAMNVFRGWISENATRRLRAIVFSALGGVGLPVARTGVDISIVLAEAEPVGNFVGVSFSEPLLQCGILISLLSYMTYLQQWMALIALASLAPQLFYVPAMQNAVNRRATSRILSLRAISGRLNRGKSSADFVLGLSRKADWIFALNMSIYKIKYFLNFLMNCSFHLSMGAILALGGYYVAIGKLDIGSVVACAGGLSRINDPWGDLVDWFRELRVTQAKYALIRTAELHARGIGRGTQ